MACQTESLIGTIQMLRTRYYLQHRPYLITFALLKYKNMKFLPLVLLLVVTTSLFTSCSNEPKINEESLTGYEKSCEEMMGTITELSQVVQTNLMAMTHPFQPVSSGLMGGPDLPAPPAEVEQKNPFEGMPMERVEAIKMTFATINSELNTLHTKSGSMIESIGTIRADIAAIRKELEAGAISEESKTTFAGITARIEEIKTGIAAYDQEIVAAQNKNLEFLNSEPSLQPGASYLLANSSKI